jgi:hypothetical protein
MACDVRRDEALTHRFFTSFFGAVTMRDPSETIVGLLGGGPHPDDLMVAPSVFFQPEPSDTSGLYPYPPLVARIILA